MKNILIHFSICKHSIKDIPLNLGTFGVPELSLVKNTFCDSFRNHINIGPAPVKYFLKLPILQINRFNYYNVTNHT